MISWVTKLSEKQMQINSVFLFPSCVIWKDQSNVISYRKKKIFNYLADLFPSHDYYYILDLWIMTEI